MFVYDFITYRTQNNLSVLDTSLTSALFSLIYLIVGGGFLKFCLINNIIVPVGYHIALLLTTNRNTYLDKSLFTLHFYEHGLSNILFLYSFWNSFPNVQSTYLDIGLLFTYNFGLSLWNYSVKSGFRNDFRTSLINNTFIDINNQILIDDEIKQNIIKNRTFESSYNIILYTITFNRSIQSFTRDSKNDLEVVSKMEQWRQLTNIYYNYDDNSYIPGIYSADVENYVLDKDSGTLIPFAEGDYDATRKYVGDGNGTHVLVNAKYTLLDTNGSEMIYHKKSNHQYADLSYSIQAFKEIARGNESNYFKITLLNSSL